MWELCVLIRPFLKNKKFYLRNNVQWSSLEKDLQNIMDCIKKFQTWSCSVYNFFASSFLAHISIKAIPDSQIGGCAVSKIGGCPIATVFFFFFNIYFNQQKIFPVAHSERYSLSRRNYKVHIMDKWCDSSFH